MKTSERKKSSHLKVRILGSLLFVSSFFFALLLLVFPGSLTPSGFASPRLAANSDFVEVNGTAGSDEIRREFRNPPKAYRPMVRWWWPGGDVNDAELIREVGLLDQAGFGGAEIQPFRFGLKPNLPPDVESRVDDYLTPSFFGHVRAATEELRRRGMWLDLTFGSGWPFGGGSNMTPELASMELQFTRERVHGPATFHRRILMPVVTMETGAFVRRVIGGSQPMPADWETRLKDRTKLVAVIAIRGTEPQTAMGPETLIGSGKETTIVKSGILDFGTTKVLTEKVASDGTLDWQVPEGDWELLTFAESAADLWVLGGVGAYPQLVMDHLKLAAMQSHIQRVGESTKQYVGSYFGQGIRAIFCDSLEVRAYIFWTNSFLEDFQRLRGYDLTPYLPYIRTPGLNDPYASGLGPPTYDAAEIGERVRRDYWQTVSDLMDQRFYEPFDDWAHQNHLLARVQAHGAPADLLKIYGQADIPETEHLYAGGKPDFLRLAASAAHLYGHPIASSESFAIAGNPYLTTPERIKTWSDELFTSGINQIVYHGYPYEYLYPPAPGWYPFTSPLAFSTDLNQHSTFWEFVRPLNEYITRMQYLAQSGKNVAQVALYRSALSYPARPMPEPEIDSLLTSAGYNFDQFNTDALLASRVDAQTLIAPGGASYSVLVVDNERQIPLPLAEKIAGFQRNGLRIIFAGKVPDGEAGLKDWQTKSAKIQELLKGFTAQANAQSAVSKMHADIKPDLAYETRSASAPFFHRKINGLDVFFLRNPDAHGKTVQLVFPVQSSPETWDPWTGTITPDYDFRWTAGGVAMKIELPPYGSRLLVFDPAHKHDPRAQPAPTSASAQSIITISQSGQKWTLAAAGQPLEITDLRDWLEIEQLKTFSGTAQYETRFNVDANWLKGTTRVELDLGEVHDVAQVNLNGNVQPPLLLRPYLLDVTALLRPGENVLRIAVTNSWTNHLLAEGMNLTNPSAPKPEPEHSGLIGPVKLTATR
jgi:hypothetical protein